MKTILVTILLTMSFSAFAILKPQEPLTISYFFTHYTNYMKDKNNKHYYAMYSRLISYTHGLHDNIMFNEVTENPKDRIICSIVKKRPQVRDNFVNLMAAELNNNWKEYKQHQRIMKQVPMALLATRTLVNIFPCEIIIRPLHRQ